MLRHTLSRLRPSSLTGLTLLRVALGVAIVILASAATSYVLLFDEIERRARNELADYVKRRVEVESGTFLLARDLQQTMVQLARERYASYRNEAALIRFDALFELGADGAVRVRAETLSRETPTTGWLRRGTPLTDELKQRMVLFYDLVEQFKPVAHARFHDVFFTAPEQLNLGTDPPGLALWAQNIPADFDQNAESWVSIASPERNPSRQTAWCVALDPVWNQLVVSVATPIDLDGRHVGSVHNDILVDSLVGDLQRSGIEGAQHGLIAPDGTLIAHTDRLNEVFLSAGALRIEDSGDETLRAVWRLIQQQPALPFVGHDSATDQYVALERIEGPGWYFATTLPGSAVRAEAFAAVQWVLWSGVLTLALVLALLTLALQRGIARPLRALAAATERIAAGDLDQPIRPARGEELTRLAAAFNDMMVRIGAREAQIKRQQSALHQSEKLAAMGSLLAGVAHELNNPLFVVSGRAMMLEGATAGTAFHAPARKIRSAAERCVRIVRTFLAMARENRSERRLLDLEQVVRGCLDVLEYTMQTNAIDVEVTAEPDLPAVCGDADQLDQVFMNLFVNAQQAMADSACPRRLRVSIRRLTEAERIEVRVADSGPGIPAEIRDRIFDPFFTTKPVGVGTGVGLSVSLGIVQEHGGTLCLDTAAPGGATFVVTLPEAPPLAEAPPEQVGDVGVRGRRVLVVDDERDVRETLRDMLALADHEVCAYAAASDALEALGAESFDAILSDVRMPGMDGVELYREIEARWPHLAARVAFMTGDGLMALSAERLRALGRPVIEKPFAPADVLSTIAALCADSG